MSIESTLERIATALEAMNENIRIANLYKEVQMGGHVIVNHEGDAEVLTAPAPAAPAPAGVTAHDLNQIMVEKFRELGNKREPIDAVLQSFGVIGVTELKPEQYQAVIDQVSAL